MDSATIIAQLPYSKPFLFVDEILQIDENGARGSYTFDKDSWFYEGHFKGYPVTPGVILTETMAQIGLVCLGIYLTRDDSDSNLAVALSSTEIEFLKPVFPGETVTVESNKIYFRFGKLKCEVRLYNSNGQQACSGTISGMLIHKNTTDE